MAKFRKIGVLTSGGDAPGMNIAIKSVVNRANDLGIEVIGINGGYAGLINGDLVELTKNKVFNIASQSGTILYSSRCKEFATKEGMQTAINTCKQNQIDALICIGGDGTFRGATDIANHGIPAVGIPGTIDNDITASDYSIGFDSAVNATTTIVDLLCNTHESHNRVAVVEAMGRHCGHIALQAGIATGATVVLVPEEKFNEKDVVEQLKTVRGYGKRALIALVAEGVETAEGKPYSEVLTDLLNENGLEARLNRPNHVVRGALPTVRDRVTATAMAVKAVELLVEGKSNVVVVERDGKLSYMDINVALIADRKYKKTLKPGDLDHFNIDQLQQIDDLVNHRTEMTNNLYTLANDIRY